MLAVLLALMRYEKVVAGIGLGIVCFAAKKRSALSHGSVAAFGCIVYEVVKAHGNLSLALADEKAGLAKAEATVESLVTERRRRCRGRGQNASGGSENGTGCYFVLCSV
jgi:hypothetical protein